MQTFKKFFVNSCVEFNDVLLYNLKGLGFKSWDDLMESLSHYKNHGSLMILLTGFLSYIATLLENYLEITPYGAAGFLVLCLLEFFTGLYASLNIDKKRWNSRRFLRMFVKIGFFITLLFVAVMMKKNNPNDPFKIFSAMYYILFNGIIVSLVISVLENLSRLGFTETNFVAKVLKNKLNKWFDLDGVDNDDKQKQNAENTEE